MFRFWTSEPRGCDKIAEVNIHHMPQNYFGLAHSLHDATDGSVPAAPSAQPKRKRSSDAGSDATGMPPSPSAAHDAPSDRPEPYPPAKRIKSESDDGRSRGLFAGASLSPKFALGMQKNDTGYMASPPCSPPPPSVTMPVTDAAEMERVKDILQYQFGLEILTKHNELRLIDQELAKCQVALEQLRRCHLIPYPTACPTPEQMLDIASGRGAAVRPRPGATVPKWAPPFGVVDGPYARHYAKWLIPDPAFDGPLPNWPGLAPQGRSKASATAEARATRHSIGDASKGRPTRGLAGQKLHSLSSGYPQPKDKAGPCVLKRADGKVVKLVCIDCHRENFSSTQGFINHCRIAHKRDFKSHEEAAVHCGHPIEVDSAAPAPGSAPASAAAAPAVPCTPAASAASAAANVAAGAAAATTLASASAAAACAPAYSVPGHVYPLARSDSEPTKALLQHVEASFKGYARPVLSADSSASASAPAKREPSVKMEKDTALAAFVGSDKTPFLSRFMQEKNMSGNLHESVEDAKETMDLDEALWADMDYESTPDPPSVAPSPPTTVKRVPARQAKTPAAAVAGSQSRAPQKSVGQGFAPHLSFGAPMGFIKTDGHDADGARLFDDVMDTGLSPNTTASNNAPSLVSDDGEYDDSDDGSSSQTSDTDLESVSDMAEINMDEDEVQDHDTPRPLRHHRSSSASASAAMKLDKQEPKHVTFVSPVRGSSNVKRK